MIFAIYSESVCNRFYEESPFVEEFKPIIVYEPAELCGCCKAPLTNPRNHCGELSFCNSCVENGLYVFYINSKEVRNVWTYGEYKKQHGAKPAMTCEECGCYKCDCENSDDRFIVNNCELKLDLPGVEL